MAISSNRFSSLQLACSEIRLTALAPKIPVRHQERQCVKPSVLRPADLQSIIFC